MRSRKLSLCLKAGLGLLLVGAVGVANPFGTATPSATASSQVESFDLLSIYSVSGEVAEIITATVDGKTLIYTDSPSGAIGLVDITDPSSPSEITTIDVGGEPTSVEVTPDGVYALAAVNTTEDVGEEEPLGRDGKLVVIDLASLSIVAEIPLGGQPDSVAVSSDGRFAVIAIENERNEEYNEGVVPQNPPGWLTIVDIDGSPPSWGLRTVALTGIADRFRTDPEPEFVTISEANLVAVTLQENNHVAIVDLETGAVVDDFSAGATTHAADLTEDADISFTDTLEDARREPDAIKWTPNGNLVTANEGDYDLDADFVGGRDFTVFSADGEVLYEPGASLEITAAEHGFYPEDRSEAKGTEPEGLAIGTYGDTTFLFVGAERGHFVEVFNFNDETNPAFVQLLPTGQRPEGLLTIPDRDLFVTANEDDGTVYIFGGSTKTTPEFPQLVAENEIGWSALSGLAAQPGGTLYAVPDNAFGTARIWTLHAGGALPWRISSTLPITKNGEAIELDLEGIAVRPQGGWWLAVEGNGTFAAPNKIVRVTQSGAVVEEVLLPTDVAIFQTSNGYEGITVNSDGSEVYVAFQRAWGDDPKGLVKIGRYTPATGDWAFYHYPIDKAPAGGWVGLSEIVAIDDETFVVIERDNQAGDNTTVKRLYSFSIAGVEPAAAGDTPPVLEKELVRDLLAEDGWTLEKIEGLAIVRGGDAVIVNDNDGQGLTRLQVIEDLFD